MQSPSPVDVAALERQLRAGSRRLRFEAGLEPPYLVDRADDVVVRRLALIGAAIALIGVTPALNAFLLHPPEAFGTLALQAQFGVMVPSLFVAGVVTWAARLRRWQDPVAVVVAFVVTCGLLFQRHVGAQMGFAVPIELVSVVLLGTAVLAGLRFAYFLPLVTAILVAFGWAEIRTFGTTASVLNAIVAMIMMGVLSAIGSYMEERGARRSWLQRKLLEQLATHDALTGLANARAFREAWPLLCATAARDGKPLLLAVLDIDHFKAYNDHYGHPAGDECLHRVARQLAAHARRATDVQARIGGEEFALAWYDVSADQAPALLEALRASVEALRIPHAAAPGGLVTISAGAVCVPPGVAVAPGEPIESADRELYAAKRQGRNRVSFRA